MRLLILVAMVLLACACSSVPKNSNGWIEPLDAIRAANDDPVHGVRGEFVLMVKNLDAYEEWSYLNSEKDYRDQRNLTVRMRTSMVPKLEERLGVGFQDLRGRRLVVLGVAKRLRINFTNEGRPTGMYYYQTHVELVSPTQVKFAD